MHNWVGKLSWIDWSCTLGKKQRLSTTFIVQKFWCCWKRRSQTSVFLNWGEFFWKVFSSSSSSSSYCGNAAMKWQTMKCVAANCVLEQQVHFALKPSETMAFWLHYPAKNRRNDSLTTIAVRICTTGVECWEMWWRGSHSWLLGGSTDETLSIFKWLFVFIRFRTLVIFERSCSVLYTSKSKARACYTHALHITHSQYGGKRLGT